MEFLKPKNQNSMQRVGFFSSVGAMIVVLFIHFPFKGYYMYRNGDCIRRGSGFLGYCEEYERTLISFFDWHSSGAIISWFGDMTNLLVTIAFIVAVGFLWIYAFGVKGNEKQEL